MSSSTTEYGIEYPDFDEIIKVCKKKIEEKFPQYKNTWTDTFTPIDWWGKDCKQKQMKYSRQNQ